MASGKKDKEVIDVEFTMKPKVAAVAVDAAYGNKPQARFEAPEQKWEDLEAIYQSSAQGIVQIGQQVNAAISQPYVKELLEDPKEVNIAISGLTRDLNNFTDALLKIHNKHAGKTGVISDSKDFALSLSLFQEYVMFNEQFKSVTLPTVLTIMDHIGAACNRIMELHNKQKEAEGTAEATPAASE